MSTSSIRVLGFLLVLSLLFPTLAWAAPATQGETIHVVEWGETLELIAARYGVTVEAVMAANGLTDPDFVYVGQRLIIPASLQARRLPLSPFVMVLRWLHWPRPMGCATPT